MDDVAEGVRHASQRSIWAFLVGVCVLSWPIWVLSGVLPRAGAGAYDFRWLIAQIGVFGPSIAALSVSAVFNRSARRSSLRTLGFVLVPLVVPGTLIARASPPKVASIPAVPAVAIVIVGALAIAFFSSRNRRLVAPAAGESPARPGRAWIGLACTMPPSIFLAAWVLANARGGEFAAAAVGGGAAAAAWTLLVCTAHNLLLGGSLGEELGWRGFLLPELLKTTTPIAASIVVGVVWGLWHLPIDLYAGFGATGVGAVVARVLFAIPVSILFTWFFLRTGGSLLVALLLHTSLNVMGDLGLSRPEATGMVFVVLVALAAVIVCLVSPEFHERRAS